MNIPDWQREGLPYAWMPYTQMRTAAIPTPVVRTVGSRLILDDGRELIDGVASWWTACHGYNHPHLIEAVKSQLEVMPHVMFGGAQHPQAMRLAKRLAEILPGDLNHVFFADSGSVAVEVALKMAVQYWINQGISGRTKFVCFQHAYHGDTSGAMAVCDPAEGMHAHFKGYLLEHFPAPLPQTAEELTAFAAFLQEHQSELAGVIIEPLVQGAGGMKFHSADAVRGIRQATQNAGLLFIADEIATGFGRTGSLFAIEQAAIIPDIICLGKALTGGVLSLSAAVATDNVFNAFLSDDPNFALMHGPTYMANPLACAAANASLDLFESEPRVQQAADMEAVLAEVLEPCRSLPGVVDVRAMGAIGVVQVETLLNLDQLRSAFVDAGVWVRPFNDIIYLTPPLSISTSDINQLAETTVKVITSFAHTGSFTAT